MTSSTGAISHKDRLIQQRRQQLDIHRYAASSRWYTYLSNAISFIDLAETSEIDMDRFYHSWRAIYNLYMMTHQSGEIENVTLLRWVEEITKVPAIRKICRELPTELLNKLLKAQNTLLKNAEQNTWRESKTTIETWLQKQQRSQELSPEKACNYTFIIGRDLRNAISHATTNPGSAKEKQAWKAAADFFLPLAIVAVEATIEQPLEGTTGRATAYRSFLYPFLKNSDSFFSDYYLEKVFESEELAALPEEEAKEGLKQLNRELTARTNTLRSATDLETTRQDWYEPVLFPTLGMNLQPGCRIVSEDSVYKPTYVLPQADFSGTLQEEYQGKAAKQDLLCLCWTLPWRTPSLDAVSDDPEFSGLTVMEVAQRALLAADVPWAIVTNGQKLRLLSKGTAHKPRCFLEADLAAIIDRRGEAEGKLAYRYLLGLFSGESFTEKDDKDKTRLERVLEGSDRYGQEISDELKQNVFRALEELGEGLLYSLRSDPEAVERYPTTYTVDPAPSENLLADIYQESLSLMYRLLFLFYAESLNLLPMEKEVYQETYSLEALRDEIRATHDDPDPTRFFSQGSTDLWDRLKELFGLVNTGMPGIGISAYNGGLFDPDQHPFLEHFKVGDYYLARAIDLLSRTRPSPNRPKGEGRKKVTYRDLDIRHLGSIYEGILEYSAHIANQELVIMLRGTSGKVHEEYVAISELDDKERQQLADWRAAVEEDSEFPRLPKGCRVRDVKKANSYYLVYGGRESKRKSSGSYYTPEYIVQHIVENTLGPLVRGENREGELKGVPLTPDEILDLKVLDPAMGSAHFLVEATEFLAKAYKKAKQLESQNTDDSDKEFIRYKRIIAERCIYGVDLNPMAVELAKLSMWLFTMDSNRPLSFLNHHLKCGNALIGARIDDLGEAPRIDRNGKARKQRLPDGQTNLFEYHFQSCIPTMISNVFTIMQQETDTYQDVQAKKVLDEAIEEIKQPFRNIADTWTGAFFGERPNNYNSFLTNVNQSRSQQVAIALDKHFFHWELSFPEVFFEQSGQRKSDSGFNAIIGNPPYVGFKGYSNEDKEFYRDKYPEIFDGKADLLYFFIFLGLVLLCPGGYLSLIVSRYWLEAEFSEKLRSFIANNKQIVELVDFQNTTIFEGVGTKTCIAIFCNNLPSQSSSFDYWRCIAEKIEVLDKSSNFEHLLIQQPNLAQSSRWHFGSSEDIDLIAKIKSNSLSLDEIADCHSGIQTGCDKAFVSNNRVEFDDVPNNLIKPLIKVGDIFRYQIIPQKNRFLVYSNDISDISAYPSLLARFENHRSKLEGRREAVKGLIRWFDLQWAREKRLFENEKLVCRYKASCNTFAYDNSQLYTSVDTTVIVIKEEYKSSFHIKYILALLNSKLLDFYFKSYGKLMDYRYEYYPTPVSLLKIKNVELDEQQAFVDLVDIILNCHNQLLTAKESKKASIQQQIEACDCQIDQLVYQLYDLTNEEIALVEEVV